MRRWMAFLLAAVMVVCMAVPAFAADGDDGGVLGVLWDIFSAIGDFFAGIFRAIWNAVKWLLDGLKALFIPRNDFFPRAFQRMSDKLSEKLGGLLGMGTYLRQRFAELRSYRGLSDSFVLRFPRGHILDGASVDLLKGSAGVLSMIRGACSGLVMLMTFAFCYRKVHQFINT